MIFLFRWRSRCDCVVCLCSGVGRVRIGLDRPGQSIEE